MSVNYLNVAVIKLDYMSDMESICEISANFPVMCLLIMVKCQEGTFCPITLAKFDPWL